VIEKIKVWDSPTRIFHWLLACSITGLWYTGSESMMDIHFPLAYVTLILIVFRIIWGFVGSHYSRFSSFPLSPKTAFKYLTNKGYTWQPGHNPLGSWGVIFMLISISLQLITGLFSNDSILKEGPLAHYISNDLSDSMTSLHSLNINYLLVLIGFHITAVLFHNFIKKEDIIVGMLTGKRTVMEPSTKPDTTTKKILLRAVLTLIISTCIFATIWSMGNT